VKTRIKIYGFAALALLATAYAMTYAENELSALVWHVRHGFHTQIGDVRVRVPLGYEADDPHGLPSFSISKFPGRLSGLGGFITFNFRRLPSLDAMEAAMDAADVQLRLKGVKTQVQRVKLAERSVTFAGRQGICVEYSAEIVELRLRSSEIDCRFDGDVSVQYIGSSNLRDDVYNIIQTAEPVTRKN
jgi:hypothetical protein